MKSFMTSIGMAVLVAAFLAAGASMSRVAATGAGALDGRTVEALKAALDDERKVRAEYGAVLEKHGEVLPFAHVIEAERFHEKLLLGLFEKYGVAVPANPYLDNKPTAADTLKAACERAVEAEKANIALYDGFLTHVTQDDIRAVFTKLRADSEERHLRAFTRCAGGKMMPGKGGGRSGKGMRGQACAGQGAGRAGCCMRGV